VASVREPTVPTKRQLLVGKVTANFCGKMVLHGQHNDPNNK
jgi:hypothetical protein